MTRSPLTSTALALIPLAAMAWPMLQVVKPVERPKFIATEPSITGSAKRADIILRAAHPYSSVEVTIGDTTCQFSSDEDFKELLFTLPESREITMTATVTWPEGTPESALLIEFSADHLETKSRTLWGVELASEEFQFNWPASK